MLGKSGPHGIARWIDGKKKSVRNLLDEFEQMDDRVRNPLKYPDPNT